MSVPESVALACSCPNTNFPEERLGGAGHILLERIETEFGCVGLDLGDGIILPVPTDRPVQVGETLTVAIRPEDIELAPARSTGSNLVGRVRSIAFAGNTTLYVVEALNREIRVRRPNTAGVKNGVAVDEEVALAWDSSAALVLA